MMGQGVIKAIVPLLNDEALGFQTTAWIQIGIDVDADCCKVAEELARNPWVLEVHEIAGEWDILAKVKAKNNLGLHDLTKSLEIPGINRMSTIVAFKTVKAIPGIEL
jgi:Lrp/AsnC family leucine-responsive transcriptional regulator